MPMELGLEVLTHCDGIYSALPELDMDLEGIPHLDAR